MPKDKLRDTNQASEPRTSHIPTPWFNFGMKAANFAVFATASTAVITLVQSPLSSLSLNKIKEGHFLPPLSAGPISVVRFLYRGLGANFAASGLRTGYVGGAKKLGSAAEVNEGSNVEEGIRETTMKGKKPTEFTIGLRGFIIAASLGEVVVTQLSSTYSDLAKLSIINKGFKWKDPYNFATLSTTRIGARFGSTLMSFASLCMLEQQIHDAMPFGEGPMKHFLAGAASGTTAAVLSLPFVSYRYVALSKVKVDAHGQLITPTTLSLVGDTLQYVKDAGGAKVVRDVAKHVVEQLPLRMMRTASTFAVICGIDAVLGKEPLARLGFFSRPDEEKSRIVNATLDSTEKLEAPSTPLPK